MTRHPNIFFASIIFNIDIAVHLSPISNLNPSSMPVSQPPPSLGEIYPGLQQASHNEFDVTTLRL